MGFQFAETMSGTVEWDAAPGVRHPLKFEITAAAESLRDHLQNGLVVVHGVISAPPRAASADVEGLMIIRPLGQRIIRYELQFHGDDGKGYELVGQKDIRWLHPLRTWTQLPAEILDEAHRRVARCQTSFDLRGDGLRFLRSFRPI